MRLSIMQPYFFPYIGYFGLIKHTDKFISFDTPQYMKRGWIQRNRILKPAGGWQYFSFPVKNKSTTISIQQALVDVDTNWKELFFRQLEHYKKKSPFYKQVIDVCKSALSTNTGSVVELNNNTTKEVCSYLGIDYNFEIFSQMDLCIEDALAPDEWALNICKAQDGVSEYWNLAGGKDFFDREKYIKAGLDIKFYSNNLPQYNQKNGAFEKGLSIIDVMMFNSQAEILTMLDDYNLE